MARVSAATSAHVRREPVARDIAASATLRYATSSAEIAVNAIARCSASRGSTRSPAAPTTPGSAPTADATTGVPDAIDSTAARPAASDITGRITARARRTRAAATAGVTAGTYASTSPTP